LSFVDASNLAVMANLRIKKIATFDKDFRNIEGIEIVGGQNRGYRDVNSK